MFFLHPNENRLMFFMIAFVIALLVFFVICMVPSSAKAESSVDSTTENTYESPTESSSTVSAGVSKPSLFSETSHIISLLQGKLTTEQIADLASFLNVRLLIPCICDLKGQDLVTVMRNIEVVGRSMDESSHYPLSLSALSTSLLLNYVLKFVPDNIRRSVIAAWKKMLPETDRNIEGLSELIDCSKNTLYAATEEFVQYGLAFNVEAPNKSGAGRPQTMMTFADAVRPIALSVGIDEECLEKRHLINAAELDVSKLKQNDSEKDSEQSVPGNYSQPDSKDGNSESDDSSEKADPVSVENIADRFETLHSNADTFLKELDIEKRDRRNAPIMFYRDLSNEINCQIGKIANVLCSNESIVSSEEIQADSSEATEASQIIRAFMKTCILESMVPAVQSLEDLLNSVRSVLAKKGTISSYYVGKEMMQVAHFKRFKRNMQTIWGGYQQRQKAMESIKDGASAIENAMKDLEFPERPAYLDDHYKETISLLNAVRKHFTEYLETHLNDNVASALHCLDELQQKIENVYTSDSTSESRGVLYGVSYIVETIRIACQEWLNFGKETHVEHSVITAVANKVLSAGFESTSKRIFNELDAVKNAESKASGSASSSEQMSDKDAADAQQTSTMSSYVSEVDLNAALEAYKSLCEQWNSLKNVLDMGIQNASHRKNSDIDAGIESIREPIQHLNSIMCSIEKIVPNSAGCTFRILNAFLSVVQQISDMFDKWLSKWEKTGDGYKASFSVSKQVSTSVLAPRHKETIHKILLSYEKNAQVDSSWNSSSTICNDYVQIENGLDKSAIDYLAPEKRAAVVLKLWNEGKDPLDIKAWIELIICAECRNNYGEPDGSTKCCRITKLELKSAFHLLTGMEYSETTLWSILTKNMGYSGRQCAKIDQIGEKDPHADEQYRYIQQQINAVDKRKTLCISIDTKAFIVLGRLKHDNGVLMCSPDGKVFKVYDHDFPLFMREIYPNGTSLVDSSRLEERAVLHPVGVYCPDVNTGYVSLVLGKDTAESVANLVRTVINIKRASMPELEEVLIMADGGGANTANGILWTEALLKLTAETGITARLIHFAPGSSRHNIIERALWSYCTMHCKGKPFLDIEHVVRLFNETTTKAMHPLKVTCWFDRKKYKTNAEKKADGEPVLTRAQLDKIADGRIYHPFDKSTSMYKWNYTVYPSSTIAAAKTAVAC